MMPTSSGPAEETTKTAATTANTCIHETSQDQSPGVPAHKGDYNITTILYNHISNSSVVTPPGPGAEQRAHLAPQL
eukprot:4475927-Heterocapsa_arctica.AAC.1